MDVLLSVASQLGAQVIDSDKQHIGTRRIIRGDGRLHKSEYAHGEND